MSDLIGTTVSERFKIIREIGRGGMGVVYLAKDELLEREVAMKFMTPAAWSAASEERFKREARIVARMDHPGIVTLFDIGKHEGSLYIVMPFVPGTSLRTRLEERTFRIKDVVDTGIQVAEALDYSHSAGVIHRDIKPENILIHQDVSGSIRIRVTDFGLARSTAETRLTQTGALVGTIEYLSPEQVLEMEMDGRSDLYSLGTVLYECFVDRTPFTGEIHSVVYRLAHDHPDSPGSLGISVPPELEAIFMQCLEKDPLKRPQKASDLVAALERYRSQMTEGENLCSGPGKTGRTTAVVIRAISDPMIGRNAEVAELVHRLNASALGESQFVIVTGDAGVGKSRLLEELSNLARARKIAVIHGRFADSYQTFPYQGFAELIREYLHARRGATLPDFSDLAFDLTALFPMLGEFDVLKFSSPRIESPRFKDRTYVYEVIARTITRMSEGKPVVILLEDLHAAGDSLDALHYVVRRLAAIPALIIATARTTDLEKGHPFLLMISTFEGDRRFLHLPLAALKPQDHHALVEQLCGRSPDPQFVQSIYEATDGNPYFTKELLRSLADSRKQSVSELGESGELSPSAPLPSTIQQAVARRIERLPEKAREVLAVGSILGRVFDYHDLEVLTGHDAEETVDQLVESGLLEEDRESRGEKLYFSSGLLREVLYSALPPRKRKSFHRKFAEYTEQRNQGRLERVYPELIHHYSQANIGEKVIDFGLKFARKSLSAFSDQDALRTSQTVLKFLLESPTPDHTLEIETRKLLAEAYRMAGRWDQALLEMETVIQLLSRHGQAEKMELAILFVAETAWLGRKLDVLRSWLPRGIETARLQKSPEVLEKLLSLGATVANLRCDSELAQEYASELEMLRESESQQEERISTGGTLMIGLCNSVQAQHPAEIQVDEENEILANIYETLLTTDAEGNLVPLLCSRWEPLEEGRAFLITLHENIRMHGGTKLTTPLLKSCWEESIRLCSKSLPAAFATLLGVNEFLEGKAGHVTGILAFSDFKLGLKLEERIPMYPAMLCDMRAAVALKKDDSILGTGPFVIGSFDPGHVILQRYDLYWKSKALLERLDFKSLQHSRDIADGFRTGRFDLVRDLPAEAMDDILKGHRSRANIVEASRKNVYYAVLNKHSPLLKSQLFTRALTESVRSQDLVRKTLGRAAQPAEGLLPPGIFGWDPGRRRTVMSVEAARAAVAPFVPLKLRISAHPVFLDRHYAFTRALFDFWAEIGIHVSVDTPDMQHYLESLKNSEAFDVLLGRWIADYDDPDSFTCGLFHSRQGALRGYYSSTELDELVEKTRSELSPERREVLYRSVEDYLSGCGYFLPLFHEVYYRVCSPKVKRLRLRSSPPYVSYSELARAESIPKGDAGKGKKGVLYIPMARRLPSLNPALAFSAVSGEVVPAVFETLVQFEEGARIAPWLASEYYSENNGRQFYFRLRDQVTFHDGRQLTARDVRYSFEQVLRNEQSKSRWMLLPVRGAAELYHGKKDHLEGFQILSNREFVIHLDQPLSFFPVLLSFPAAGIIAESSDPNQENWQAGCIGTGPFRVLHFDPNESAQLEANPTYWRSGFPRNEGLVFTFGVSPADIASGFRGGRFSIASDLLPEDVEKLRREAEFADQHYECPQLATEYIAFNIHRPPLDSELIRRQLVRAIDVDSLVRRKLGRLGIPAQGIIPPGMLGFELLPAWKSSSPTGKINLGIEVTACVSPRHQGRYAALSEEVFQAWERVGVRVKRVFPTEAEYSAILNSPSVDLTVTGWSADYPDPDTFAYGALHSEQGADGKFCGIKEIDSLSEKARLEPDPDSRHQTYREIEKLFAQQSLVLPLFHQQTYCFARPEVANVKLNFFYPAVAYEFLSVK